MRNDLKVDPWFLMRFCFFKGLYEIILTQLFGGVIYIRQMKGCTIDAPIFHATGCERYSHDEQTV